MIHIVRRFMHGLIMVSLCWLVVPALADNFTQLQTPREFTLQDGQTLTLKVIDWNEQNKKFQVENEKGKRTWISPKSFQDSDQAYFKEWIIAQWFLSNDKVYVSAKRAMRHDHVTYNVSIQNKTPVDYDKVTLKYEVVRVLDNYETKKQEDKNVPGKIFVGSLKAGSRRDFKTQPVRASETYVMVETKDPVRVTSGVGYTYTNEVPRKVGKEKVNGVRLKFHGPKLNGAQIIREVKIDK